MSQPEFDSDVVVIGSGFGGSVAALRFVEAGEKVLVLERGNFVSRANFEVDLNTFWDPERNAFGFDDFKKRGKTIMPWLGAAVGGGSYVFAGTLIRRDSFADFPGDITVEAMNRYYEIAEDMMVATPYPDYSPYDEVRATQLCFHAGARLAARYPELVQAYGPLPLGISFAPPGGHPGASFINKYGAPQRYQDPWEQAILGGDIDTKNTLDRNYLFVAQQKGAEIKPLHEVDKIEPIDGGYQIHCREYLPEGRTWRGLMRTYFPRWLSPNYRHVSYTAKRVVVAAGAVGSAELLLRNRDWHKTLPALSPQLGQRYTTNGDWITLMIPAPGMVALSWLGFVGLLMMLLIHHILMMLPFAFLYYGALFWSRSINPDYGTTNSDYVMFKGRQGENQGAYIESGTYPSPGKTIIAFFLSLFRAYTPQRYIIISKFVHWIRVLIPPFGALARTWPIPLLTMGADDAVGSIKLNKAGKAVINYDPKQNQDYYAYVSRLGRLMAQAVGALWSPNFSFLAFKTLEVPHNLGGVPMGDSIKTGVVDNCGRAFGLKNFMVLDGSIIPETMKPNPSLTILALAERAMEQVLAQIRLTGEIMADQLDTGKAEAAATKEDR